MQPADRPADLNPPRASHSYGPPMAYEPGGDDPAAYAEPAGPPTQRINARLVWRAFRRHWWQATLLWAAGSAALMTLAYHKVKPTYDARSLLVRIEPGEQSLFTPQGRRRRLRRVQGDPGRRHQPDRARYGPGRAPWALFPRLRAPTTPRPRSAWHCSVAIIPKTNLVQVSMSSESPTESAVIVNAVVDAYLKNASASNNEEKDKRIKQLKETRDDRPGGRPRGRSGPSCNGSTTRSGPTRRPASVTATSRRSTSTAAGARSWPPEITAIATQAKVQQLRDQRPSPPRQGRR